MEDRGLIERARRGDADAYDVLVRRYQELAFRTAFVITRAAQEAEEAAQDGFVKAYFALPRFRLDAPFRPWLLRIVANEARNRRVAAGRRAALSLRAAASTQTDRAESSPEETALATERRSDLLAAVNALGERDRLVIAYRYFLDLTEEEMAGAMGCARGTVKSRLARALGRLRTQVGDRMAREDRSHG